MVQVNLPVVYIIHIQSNKFVTGAKIQEAGDLKLDDSPITFVTVDCFEYAVN